MTHVLASATAQPLRDARLEKAPVGVALPAYDRAAITPGVAHIGVGGFHRAHQGTYWHDLAELGVSDWGVVGIGLHSRGVKEALERQGLLYTVVERGAGGDSARVIGTLTRYLYAPDDPEAVYAALADPQIRLVTLTVTGEGYHVDPESLELRADAPELRADLRGAGCCATFAAYVVEALDRRRHAGVAPFTVLSCDNVPRNGSVARAAVVGFARLRDPALASWIDAHVAFPSSMVDRITPSAVQDGSPVITEPFRQWIVEDAFCSDRPPLDAVGVQFVDDVAPYEVIKKRMLNGAHSALGYLGHLAGCPTTDAVMNDAVLRAYVARLLRREIGPLLPPAPGIDTAEYAATLLARFSNPRIGDELSRLCRRGSTKVPAYLLPSLSEAMAGNRRHRLLTLAVAGWVSYLRTGCETDDPRLDELRALARDPREFASERSIFGHLADDPSFAETIAAGVRQIAQLGPRGAIAAELRPSSEPPRRPARARIGSPAR